MLASAAIPVAFPPVMFDVEAGGRKYEEMHVDGSVATQSFGIFLVTGHQETKDKLVNYYMIRNGKFADVLKQVPLKVWDIAGSVFSMMMTWQGYSDVFRLHAMAKYENFRAYFTCVPYDFNEPRSSEFDLAYMRKLFNYAYETASSKGFWYRQIGERIDENVQSGM